MVQFWQTIVEIVNNFWKGFVAAFQLCFQWLSECYKLYTWAVWVFLGLLVFTFTYLVDAVGYIGQLLPDMVQAASGARYVGGEQIPGPLAQAFSLANAFFPLTEAFGFVVAIGPVWMTAVLIRMSKSLIPGVA